VEEGKKAPQVPGFDRKTHRTRGSGIRQLKDTTDGGSEAQQRDNTHKTDLGTKKKSEQKKKTLEGAQTGGKGIAEEAGEAVPINRPMASLDPQH